MKWTQLFIQSAGAILLAAALERFLIAFGDAQVLSVAEPMMGIPLRYAVLLVGGVEFTVAFVCLFGKHSNLQIGSLAWLATTYALYWTGLAIIHCHPQGSGIGSLTDPLRLRGGTLGFFVKLLPACLLLGSYTAMISLWRADRRAIAAHFLRMSCPACGIHIRFADRNLGQIIPCPHCQAWITLRGLEHLKMTCFFCGGHIEFPAHSLGTKMPCPHCKKDITLKEMA